jgi:hypothetical protein
MKYIEITANIKSQNYMKIMRKKLQDNINFRKIYQEITPVNVCC